MFVGIIIRDTQEIRSNDIKREFIELLLLFFLLWNYCVNPMLWTDMKKRFIGMDDIRAI